MGEDVNHIHPAPLDCPRRKQDDDIPVGIGDPRGPEGNPRPTRLGLPEGLDGRRETDLRLFNEIHSDIGDDPLPDPERVAYQLRREPIIPRGIADDEAVVFQSEFPGAGACRRHEQEKENDDRRYGFSHIKGSALIRQCFSRREYREYDPACQLKFGGTPLRSTRKQEKGTLRRERQTGSS